MRVLHTLLLILLQGALWGRSSMPQEAPSVRVLQGSARVANEEGVKRLTQRSPGMLLSAGAHLEQGLRDTVQVRWPRAMSITVRGFSSFGIPVREAEDASQRAAFYFFGSAEVELRRGLLVLDLPQRWRVKLQRGSYFIKEHSDGSIELHNRGRLPVEIIDRSTAKRRIPARLLGGRSLRLPKAK